MIHLNNYDLGRMISVFLFKFTHQLLTLHIINANFFYEF